MIFGHWFPTHFRFPILLLTCCVVLVTLMPYTGSKANICNACNFTDGFWEQRPRWGILPIRHSASPRANTANLGPVTGPIRNYLINIIIVTRVVWCGRFKLCFKAKGLNKK